MENKSHIIYIEADEEITSVISRIKKEHAGHVTIVVPKGGLMLQSIVNLKMLKRHEKNLDKKITVVTADRVGLHLASEVGFEALRSLDAKPEKVIEDDPEAGKEKDEEKPSAKDISFVKKPVEEKEKTGPQIVFTKPLEEEEKAEIEEAPKVSHHKVEEKKELPSKKKKRKLSKAMKMLLIGFGGIVLIMTALGAIFVLPKATIIVTPLSQELRQDVELKVALGDGNSIKGELLEESKDGTKEVSTTGTKNVGEKAKGTITVYNEWDSTPQPLVSGTRFSSGGKVFKTTADVTVPGTKVSGGSIVPGTANVNVEASESGEVYNIGPSNFTIPGLPAEKQSKIYGKSSQAMTGGSTRTVKVVSAADIENAKKTLSEEMMTEAKKDFEKKADKQKMLDAAISESVLKEEFSKKEGEEAENLTLSSTKNYWVIVFQEANAKQEISSKLKETLPENKELVPDKFTNIEYKVVESTKENGMTLAASVSTFTMEKLDLEKSKYDISGKTRDQVISYFKEKESVMNVDVNFWPFWVKKIPLNRSRIFIEVNVETAGGQNTGN